MEAARPGRSGPLLHLYSEVTPPPEPPRFSGGGWRLCLQVERGSKNLWTCVRTPTYLLGGWAKWLIHVNDAWNTDIT